MGNSGTGKILMVKTIESYCYMYGISFSHFNSFMSDFINDVIIIQNCMNKDVVLMDNVDLYLTKNLLDKIKILGIKYIIIVRKSMYGLLDVDDKYKTYDVKFDSHTLVTKEY